MGNGSAPEVFTVLCGITTKSLTQQVNTSDVFSRDCALPEDVPVRDIVLSGRQWDIRGSGQLNRDNIALLDAAVGVIKNFRFFIRAKVGETGAALNGYYGGGAVITTRTINGDDGGFVGIDLAIASNGVWTWTPVAIV
jgi:hypothetical protein